MILGNCRSVYYISNKSQLDIKRLDNLLLKLTGTTSELLVQDGSVLDQNAFRLPLSAGYDVLLSLLVPEPETLESTWDIVRGVKG